MGRSEPGGRMVRTACIWQRDQDVQRPGGQLEDGVFGNSEKFSLVGVWSVSERMVRTEATKAWGDHREPHEACLEFGVDPLKVLGEAAGWFQQEVTVNWTGLCTWWLMNCGVQETEGGLPADPWLLGCWLTKKEAAGIAQAGLGGRWWV